MEQIIIAIILVATLAAYSMALAALISWHYKNLKAKHKRNYNQAKQDYINSLEHHKTN